MINIYHLFLFLHLVFLIIGFGSVMVIDTCGLLWLLKKVKLSFTMSVAKITQPLIWMGWSGMVLTGIPLLWIKDVVSSLSTLKIFFVILIGINGIYLHFIKKSFEGISDSESIPKILYFRISFATFVSQLGWWSSIMIGFLNNKLKDNAPEIPNPIIYIFVILIILFTIFSIGNKLFKEK